MDDNRQQMIDEIMGLARQNRFLIIGADFLTALAPDKLNAIRMMLAAHRTVEDELLEELLSTRSDSIDDEEDGDDEEVDQNVLRAWGG
ncbi:MAG: hypothetical protein WCV69_04850 [Patescibacteria group bacterium]|jgi:hypothetical protein